MELSHARIAVFFTRGLSFQVWEKAGIVEREIKIYQLMAEKVQNVYFFSYGCNEGLRYAHLFSKNGNIKIISRPWWCPVFLYTLLLPLIHQKVLKEVTILKTNQMDGSLTAVIAKKLFGIPLVVRCGYEWLQYLENTHSAFWKRWITEVIENISYRNADRIIITSSGGKDFIVKRFRISEKKMAVIPNWIDTDIFAPLAIGKDPKRIVFVGRLEPVKNLQNLVSAMEGIDADLAIIGEGNDRATLEVLAKSKNVRVEFLGVVPQSELPHELSKSSIFVLPSLSEGNPKALLEAMACGLPSVGTNVFGIREVISSGENGILCGTDASSIKNAFQELLGNEMLRKKLGDQARNEIVEKYSMPHILQTELSVYNQML